MLKAASQWQRSAQEKVCSETHLPSCKWNRKVQAVTLFSKDIRYMKQVLFNDFLCNGFVMYNSEL